MSKRLSESEALGPHPKRQLLSSDNAALEPEPAIHHDDPDKSLFMILHSLFRPEPGEKFNKEQAAAMLFLIMGRSDAFSRKFQNIREVEDVVSAHPDLINDLWSAWEACSLKPLLSSSLLRSVAHAVVSESEGLNVARPRGNQEEQEWATQKSWESEFRGNAAIGLWAHVKANYNRRTMPKVYANYSSIVQSSGMGKSRTVDELAKTCFVITMNLRAANTTGYPPADNTLRDYLTTVASKNEAFDHADTFFEALFQHTLQTLQQDYTGLSYSKVASEFRKQMTQGQTMKSHNQYHIQFYDEVIREASRLRRGPQSQSTLSEPPLMTDKSKSHSQPGTSANSALKRLSEYLESLRPKGERKNEAPFIVLAFDEAHIIAERKGADGGQWSVFHQVRQLLRSFRDLPIFSLFLSTTGKISRFTSAAEDDLSKRIIKGDLVAGQPLTDLGFDPFAVKISLNGNWDLKGLTEDAHICTMGRPLFATRWLEGTDDVKRDIIIFAAAKLMAKECVEEFSDDQKLACLSQRFPIEFNSTNYIEQSKERTQVEGHMRVCLKIDGAFQTMTTASSSEPILSEAAYFLMMRDQSFNAAKALKSVMEGFAISKGDRGEFLVLLLLTLARDATVGPPTVYGRPEKKDRFFSLPEFLCGQVFNPKSEESAEALRKLASDFPEAKLHFTHFVKVHEYKAIDLTSLLLLKGRGAGILCANNQKGVDIISVFLKDGMKLERRNAGLILIQVKNDSAYSNNPQQKLFDAMDPYDLDILKDNDSAVPIIKIVFALAAKKPSLRVIRKNASSSYLAVTYEIWCAGLSPEVLQPVKEKGVWESLLQASYGWKALYEAPSDIAKALRQAATPGAAREVGHYSCWATRED